MKHTHMHIVSEVRKLEQNERVGGKKRDQSNPTARQAGAGPQFTVLQLVVQ